MLFSVESKRSGRKTHCGVLEFIADEGLAHMPHWMMQNLAITEGEHITLKSVQIPVATFAKFQPQSVDFLDISDPKAVLENELRSYSCLTEGDVIAIEYNSKVYEIMVLEIKPKSESKAVSIVECDLVLDFAAPVGYVEPEHPPPRPTAAVQNAAALASKAEAERAEVAAEEKAAVDATVFHTYTGTANRLDGKATKQGEIIPVAAGGVVSEKAKMDAMRAARAKAAEARFKPGKLSFAANSVASPAAAPAAGKSADTAGGSKPATPSWGGEKTSDSSAASSPAAEFVPFGGTGNTLR